MPAPRGQAGRRRLPLESGTGWQGGPNRGPERSGGSRWGQEGCGGSISGLASVFAYDAAHAAGGAVARDGALAGDGGAGGRQPDRGRDGGPLVHGGGAG